MNEQEQEKADHMAQANRALFQATEAFGVEPDSETHVAAAIAQVHASLAIAEELRAANGWLENISNELLRAQS